MSLILKAVSLMLLMKLEFSTTQSDIYTSGASGSKIVKDAVSKVESTLGGTNQFLKRIAYVESKNGQDPNTYRDGYHGGIWQVDQIGFEDTQNVASHPKLGKHFEKIEKQFGIKWVDVKYEDLRKPLISALAARLKLLNMKPTIPPSWDAGRQGEMWKKYYNTESGKGTAEKFKSKISKIDKWSDVSKYGDCAKGEKLFKQKAAQCHSIEPGGGHKQGPNLFGVCGRRAGKSPGFSYSQAMEDSGITWNEDTLGQYLEYPKALIPGTKMVFAGLKKEKDRRNLIYYLCRCGNN